MTSARLPFHRVTLFGLFSLTAGIVGSYLYSHVDRSTVFPAPGGTILSIRDGACYTAVIDDKCVRLVVTDLETGKARELCHEDVTNRVVSSGGLHGDWYYYSYTQKPELAESFRASPGVVGGGRNIGSNYRAPETRPVQPSPPVLGPPIEAVFIERMREWHRLPLSGGQPERVSIDAYTRSLSTTCIDGTIYWIDTTGSSIQPVTEGKQQRFEIPSTRRIMAQREGEAPHVYYTGAVERLCSSNPQHEATDQRLFWIEPRPYPDSKSDLYFMTDADRKVGVIRDYSRTAPSPPIELNGRLYWLTIVSTSQSGYSSDSTKCSLVSTRADGMGYQNHCTFNDIEISQSSLDRNGNNLFVKYKLKEKMTGSGSPYLIYYIGRIDPKTGSLTELCQLPPLTGPYWIDGANVYCLTGIVPNAESVDSKVVRIPIR